MPTTDVTRGCKGAVPPGQEDDGLDHGQATPFLCIFLSISLCPSLGTNKTGSRGRGVVEGQLTPRRRPICRIWEEVIPHRGLYKRPKITDLKQRKQYMHLQVGMIGFHDSCNNRFVLFVVYIYLARSTLQPAYVCNFPYTLGGAIHRCNSR